MNATKYLYQYAMKYQYLRLFLSYQFTYQL